MRRLELLGSGRWWVAVACLASIIALGGAVGADDTPPAEPAAAGDSLQAPDGNVAELLTFIGEVAARRPAVRTREEYTAYMLQAQRAIADAATRVLSGDAGEATADQRTQAAQAALAALNTLNQLSDPQAAAQLEELVLRLAKDPAPEIASIATLHALRIRAQNFDSDNPEALSALAGEVQEYLASAPVSRDAFSMGMTVCRTAEQAGAKDVATNLYRTLATWLRGSTDPQMTRYADKMEGSARRVSLVGQEMEIDGTRTDGETFGWSSYRGKVVLVDFWATWCGPCIAELPNLLEQYERYHERGFEVVGISLDSDRARLDAFLQQRKLPWPVLFSGDESATGWDHPMATHYGVMSIPTAVLVDRDGRVITLSARGNELPRLLAELIGPPEPPAEAPASEAPAAGEAAPAPAPAEAPAAPRSE